MISELVWLGVLEWTVYHALIINVDYRAGWIISISTNRSFIYILTYLASQWQLSSTACVPRFALFYWCTWFMKQVLQVSQGYVLYIFKCMIFFSKRNFFRIVFHKMMMYFNFTYLKICSVLWKKTCLIFKLLCLLKHIYFFLLAWADLSKQNENFPLFGSYETPNADKTITWKIWISYWKRKAVLTTNAKKIFCSKSIWKIWTMTKNAKNFF